MNRLFTSLFEATCLIALLVVASATTASPVQPRVVELGLVAIVEKSGQLYAVTSNGRFAIEGRITDLWEKKQLNTFEQVKQSVETVNLTAWGMNPERWNAIAFGTGPKDVTVFVDPLCSACKHFIDLAKGYTAEYTFHLAVVPALGDQSNKLARTVYCSSENQDRLGALLGNRIQTLAQQPDCDTAGYDQMLLAAHLLEIKAVPYLISPSGHRRTGAGPSVWAWLENH